MSGFESFPEGGSTWGSVRDRVERMLREIYTGALSLTGPMSIGGDTDYTLFDADGSIRHYGDATIWDDIQNSLVGRSLSSTAGKVDYDWAENAISFDPSGDIDVQNDCVIFNLQMPHARKDGTAVRLHMHWEQIDAVAREFTVRYRVQEQGAAKQASWTDAVVDITASPAFVYSSGTLNQITGLVNITVPDLSDVVQFRVTRTDAIANPIRVTFIDAHIEMDSEGSRQEYVK